MLITFLGVEVEIENVTNKEYAHIRKFLETELQRQRKKRDAISNTFFYAIQLCPEANPSDIWYHIIYRTFIQLPNQSNPHQSWVRAGGEALEIFFECYYNPLLGQHGIKMRSLISRQARRDSLLKMDIDKEVGDAKLDIVLEGEMSGQYYVFGGAHVKASLAERVSDDVPTSLAMMARRLFSPLLTLDVKSFPPPHGDLINRGELGSVEKPSEKRKYIEIHGSFDNCYSYNLKTVPSKSPTPSGKCIIVQNLKMEPDVFVKDVVKHWNNFSKAL